MSGPSEAGKHAPVSVIVVTHNNGALIEECLSAILLAVHANGTQVVVVDNASSDDTLDLIAHHSWPVDVIALEQNVGFARAVNRALTHVRSEYVVLVNSDAVLDPGCIDRLVEALQRSPQTGIVGAKLRYPSGRLQPSAGGFPSLSSGVWVALFLHRLPVFSRLGIGYLADSRLYRQPRRVDWVSAAVCAARKDVGLLPTSSFMYGEDVEWAWTCREAGREVWLEPAATAIHIGRASVDRSQALGFAQRQRVQFELAWFARRGPRQVKLARLVLLLHAVLRIGLYGVLDRLRRDPRRREDEYAALLRAAWSSTPHTRR